MEFEWWKYSVERYYTIGVGRNGLMKHNQLKYNVKSNALMPRHHNSTNHKLLQATIQIKTKHK